MRLRIGEAKASSRPGIERAELTSRRSPAATAELVRQVLDQAAALLGGLTDAQLDLVAQPPRAGDASLATTIERVMIGYVDHHRAEIESKLAGPAAR